METRLRNLLDQIYELEGLVHLSLKRTELHDDFIRLISLKGKQVQELCSSLYAEKENLQGQGKDDTSKSTSEASAPYVLEEYSLEEESVEDNEFLYEMEEDIAERKTRLIPADENSRGKLVFSINDKFRFKRDLFNDSEAEFNNTLVLVASMENYDEAEDYFINEQGWDGNDVNVNDFLEIIKQYFR